MIGTQAVDWHLFLFASLWLALFAQAASAEVPLPQQTIYGCQELSNPDTIYNLAADIAIGLDGETNHCFRVTAPRVTLDCNGKWVNISSSSEKSGKGFYSNQDYTLLKNCNFNVTNNHAVHFHSNRYGNIKNVRAYAEGNQSNGDKTGYDAIRLESSSDNVISNCAGTTYRGNGISLLEYSRNNTIINSSGTANENELYSTSYYLSNGIYLYHYSTNNKIVNSNGTSNVNSGIFLSVSCGGNEINNSAGTTVHGTNGDGIRIHGSSDNLVANSRGACTMGQGRGIAIASTSAYALADRNVIINSTGSAYSYESVWLHSDGNQVINSSGNSYSNGAYYDDGALLVEGNDNWVIGSNWTSSKNRGILIRGENNTIQNSIGVSLRHAEGIRIESGANNMIDDSTGIADDSSGIAIISDSNRVQKSIGESNSGYGIRVGANAENNLIDNSTGTSVYTSGIGIEGSGNAINRSFGRSENAGSGIAIFGNYNDLFESKGQSNLNHGISLLSSASANKIVGSFGTSNMGSGIRLTDSANHNTINGSLFKSNYSYGAYLLGTPPFGGGYNTFINNTFLSSTAHVHIAQTGNNTFYWNNFTATSGAYVQDSGTGNKYNATIDGKPEGNIWANVINGSVAITGSMPSLYGTGWKIGSGGAGYPYNPPNSQGKFICADTGCRDYAPLVSSPNSPPAIPGAPHLSPENLTDIGTPIICDQNCTPTPDPDGDAVHIEYLWCDMYIGCEWHYIDEDAGSWEYNWTLDETPPEYMVFGDNGITLQTRACDSQGLCSDASDPSNEVWIVDCFAQVNNPPHIPLQPQIAPSPKVSQGGTLSCTANCPPAALPEDVDNYINDVCPSIPENIIHMEYLWNRTRGADSHLTPWSSGVPQYDCAANDCLPGDKIRLGSRACDQFGACSNIIGSYNFISYSPQTTVMPNAPVIAYVGSSRRTVQCIANCDSYVNGSMYGIFWMKNGAYYTCTSTPQDPYAPPTGAYSIGDNITLRKTGPITVPCGAGSFSVDSNVLQILNSPPNAPPAPHISPSDPSGYALIGTNVACDGNCPPSQMPSDSDPGDIVSIGSYEWYANGVLVSSTGTVIGNYDCTTGNPDFVCTAGTKIRLKSIVCDQTMLCTESPFSNEVEIVASPPPPPPPLPPLTEFTAIILALGIVIGILALAYMSSYLFSMPQLRAIVADELLQVGATALIAFSLLSIHAGANAAFSSLGGAPTVFEAAQGKLSSLTEISIHVIDELSDASGKLGSEGSKGIFCNFLGVGFSLVNCSQLNVFRGSLTTAAFTVVAGLADLYAQQALLSFIAATAFPIMLPIGLFLRCFKAGRRAGGALVAMAFGFYVIYPAMIVATDGFLHSTCIGNEICAGHSTSGSCNGDSANGCAWLSPAAVELGVPEFGECNPYEANIGKVKNEFKDYANDLSAFEYSGKLTYFVLVRVIFLSILNLIVTLGFIRSLAHVIGSDIDVSSLARIS